MIDIPCYMEAVCFGFSMGFAKTVWILGVPQSGLGNSQSCMSS